MTIGTIIFLIVFLVCSVVILLVVLGLPPFGSAGTENNFRAMFEAQRGAGNDVPRQVVAEDAFEEAKKKTVRKTSDSRATIERRLKWAQWKMPALTFHSIEAGISLTAFLLGAIIFGPILLLVCLSTGPLIMRTILDRAVEKRFSEFDKDYPSFLLSLVGLLKTGMNPISAIEATSRGMEETSLIKQEIDVMLERMRYGVPEEQSIGGFAEDIFHPEVELFVQALLLSKAVGGTLSDTLDRLARSVRKRQHFRKSAKAAVGMQRGSIWFILVMMVSLEGYLWFMYPEVVEGAISDETGWQVWQVAITLILSGIYWIKTVTKIKV
jgi:tight adherence protein B